MNLDEQAESFTAMDALALTFEQFGVDVPECDPYDDYEDDEL